MSEKADSSLARMLGVLDLFSEQRLHWSAEDIGEALGVSLPTSYRYLKTLSDAGLLQRRPDAQFTLGPRIVEFDRQIRLRDLQAVYEAGAGHIGGEMSSIDILTALYFRVLRLWPDQPKHPERDRFVLSKGHVALALYVTLVLE